LGKFRAFLGLFHAYFGNFDGNETMMTLKGTISVRLDPPFLSKAAVVAKEYSAREWEDIGFSPLSVHHDDPFYPHSGVDADDHLMRRRRAAEKLGRMLADHILKVLGEQDPVRGYPSERGEK
jgi:hypothetical protein